MSACAAIRKEHPRRPQAKGPLPAPDTDDIVRVWQVNRTLALAMADANRKAARPQSIITENSKC